jgi:hypothetical protein
MNRYVIVDCNGDSTTITTDPESVLEDLNNDCLDDGKPFSVGYICVPVDDWQAIVTAVGKFDRRRDGPALAAIGPAALAAVRNMREAQP